MGSIFRFPFAGAAAYTKETDGVLARPFTTTFQSRTRELHEHAFNAAQAHMSAAVAEFAIDDLLIHLSGIATGCMGSRPQNSLRYIDYAIDRAQAEGLTADTNPRLAQFLLARERLQADDPLAAATALLTVLIDNLDRSELLMDRAEAAARGGDAVLH